jgi:hypothetical protein
VTVIFQIALIFQIARVQKSRAIAWGNIEAVRKAKRIVQGSAQFNPLPRAVFERELTQGKGHKNSPMTP